jgi:predicted nucleotidyltransferase
MIDFHSKARQKVLGFYFTNPTARLHLRDLAQRIGVDPSNLSRDLRRLEVEGLFKSEIVGRQRYFRLDPTYSLFREIRSIVIKTIGAGPLITGAFSKLGEIEEAYLYGSFARNQQDAASDIDVLVIGTPRGEPLAAAIAKLERQLGREINYFVVSRTEFDLRLARQDAFLKNVWQNKRVLLIGSHEKDQASSRRLGANRPLPRQRSQKDRVRKKNSRVR